MVKQGAAFNSPLLLCNGRKSDWDEGRDTFGEKGDVLETAFPETLICQIKMTGHISGIVRVRTYSDNGSA